MYIVLTKLLNKSIEINANDDNTIKLINKNEFILFVYEQIWQIDRRKFSNNTKNKRRHCWRRAIKVNEKNIKKHIICWHENICSIILQTLNIKHEFDLIVDLSKHDFFAISFHFIDLLITNRFIARNTNMQKMKRNLFSNNTINKRKIYIFYDFDEIEKMQLIVVYFKKHQKIYSAILWMNDNNKNTFMQNFVAFDKHANFNFVSKAIVVAIQNVEYVEAKARIVLKWFVFSKNRRWLMIVDNVDRNYNENDEIFLTYDI